MSTSRPKTITAISILLGVLALLSLVTFALSFRAIGFLRNGPQDFQNGGNLQGRGFQTAPGGQGGTFQGGPGGNFRGGAVRVGGAGAPGLFRLLGGARAMGLNGTTLIIVRSVFAVLWIGLALLSAWFVWKQKRWALNLAIVLAFIFLLGALPGLFLGGGRGLFNGFGFVQTGLSALKVLAALPVIVLGMLPSVRDFTS
jgi:hypothetical protein